MADSRSYATLKEAARILGVHEQTIRNWGRRGVIRLVRLPGSRHRRVPTSELTRLKAQMAQGESYVSGEVRLVSPSGDPDLVARGQALAKAIKEALAAIEPATTLEETMCSLRGRSWSS